MPAVGRRRTEARGEPLIRIAMPRQRVNDFLTYATAPKRMEQFIARMPKYRDQYRGSGIVICGGGFKYFVNAWVCLRLLRHLGCSLPIQIWHLGPQEVDERMKVITAPYNVEFVDAFQVREKHPVRILNGWELKPFAILHSPFREVMLLDADNVPVANPEFLLASPEFQRTGAIFWPDFGHLPPSSPIWGLIGLPFVDEPEWEAGQILVDKKKCWRALQLAMWLNEYSDFYYQFILGDKETFHLAFRKLKKSVSIPQTPVRALKNSLCQHDFQGKRLFQHRIGDKWSLNRENNRIWGFELEDECRAFLDELQVIWFGKKQLVARFSNASCSRKINALAQEIVHGTYIYERLGFDSRPMSFSIDGRVTEGGGQFETYWDLKEIDGKIILLISSRSELTCDLERQTDGSWTGKWVRFERMPIVLTRLNGPV